MIINNNKMENWAAQDFLSFLSLQAVPRKSLLRCAGGLVEYHAISFPHQMPRLSIFLSNLLQMHILSLAQGKSCRLGKARPALSRNNCHSGAEVHEAEWPSSTSSQPMAKDR